YRGGGRLADGDRQLPAGLDEADGVAVAAHRRLDGHQRQAEDRFPRRRRELDAVLEDEAVPHEARVLGCAALPDEHAAVEREGDVALVELPGVAEGSPLR